MLKAKLANLREIKPTRLQDIHHTRLLLILVNEYLRDLHAQVAANHATERTLVNALHELLDLIMAPRVRGVAAEHCLVLETALPADLPITGMPKLAAFYKHRR